MSRNNWKQLIVVLNAQVGISLTDSFITRTLPGLPEKSWTVYKCYLRKRGYISLRQKGTRTFAVLKSIPEDLNSSHPNKPQPVLKKAQIKAKKKIYQPVRQKETVRKKEKPSGYFKWSDYDDNLIF